MQGRPLAALPDVFLLTELIKKVRRRSGAVGVTGL
jgi:hypothetical protein